MGRLFPNVRDEEERYLGEEGYFPIMHVVALNVRPPSATRIWPGLSSRGSSARRLTRTRWDDPNWSMLIWGRHELERQEALCSFDPWQNGLAANRKNLDRFATYSNEQGLTGRRLSPDELFVPVEA